MNDFLKALAKSLKHMDKRERDEILADYQEHFEVGLAAGKTREAVAQALGDPQQLAKMYAAMGATSKAIKTSSLRDAMRMIGAIAKYKLGGGLVMGTIYFTCICALATLFTTAGGLALGGAASLVLMAMEFVKGGIVYGVAALFLTLVLGSGGLLGIVYTSRLWRITIGRLPHLARSMMSYQDDEEEE